MYTTDNSLQENLFLHINHNKAVDSVNLVLGFHKTIAIMTMIMVIIIIITMDHVNVKTNRGIVHMIIMIVIMIVIINVIMIVIINVVADKDVHLVMIEVHAIIMTAYTVIMSD